MSDETETFQVSTKESVINKNLHDGLIKSSRHWPCDIKWAFFRPLHLLNYVSDRVETLHVSTKGSVIDEN